MLTDISLDTKKLLNIPNNTKKAKKNINNVIEQ